MIGGMALLSFAFLFIHVSSSPRSETTPTPSEAGASPWAFVAVLAMCMFCVSYALGLGNVAWVVQSEVSAQRCSRACDPGQLIFLKGGGKGV